ncbi:bacteriohemerythrin [Pseudomonadota bacterium]
MESSPFTIVWSDALSMSNPEIDAEHQNFIKLVNKLNTEIMSQKRDKAVVEQIMNHIMKDAIAHFSHEERLFAEKGFPGAEEHTEIHSELITKFEQALKEIQNSDFGEVWIKAGLEIKDLLVSHVINEDTKYIKYLRTE